MPYSSRLRIALARIMAGRAGLRLAASNPSTEQCAAGARAANVTSDVARAVYRAMLEADEDEYTAP